MAILALSDTKDHLNIPQTVKTFDTELQGFIDAVQTVVEDITGPVATRVITGEVHDGGMFQIVTLYGPIISIQSLTEYVGPIAYTLTSQPLGSTANNYGYELTDPSGIILRRSSAGMAIPFQAGVGGVVIAYTAGYATLPANVRLGALELVRHWWQQSQQGGRPSFAATGEEGLGGVQYGSYLVPHFVAELLASSPYATRRLPGIA